MSRSFFPHSSGHQAAPVGSHHLAAVGSALTAALLLAYPSDLAAQAGAGVEPPDAAPADVESIEAIIEAGYDAISGGPDEPRNWDRFRSLLRPDARLVVTFRQEGEPSLQSLTADQFIQVAKQTFVKEGMYEEPVHTITERFGDIAHVWVTDASRHTPGAEPFERGINSFQLWHDGDRWWVITIMLHAERPGAPIPERYGG